jgi:hypothetical protein
MEAHEVRPIWVSRAHIGIQFKLLTNKARHRIRIFGDGAPQFVISEFSALHSHARPRRRTCSMRELCAFQAKKQFKAYPSRRAIIGDRRPMLPPAGCSLRGGRSACLIKAGVLQGVLKRIPSNNSFDKDLFSG